MAVVIRLARGGKKNSPHFSVVAADEDFSRDGRFLEKLGYYNPKADKIEDKIHVKPELIQKWVARGARLSDTIATLLKKRGVATRA